MTRESAEITAYKLNACNDNLSYNITKNWQNIIKIEFFSLWNTLYLWLIKWFATPCSKTIFHPLKAYHHHSEIVGQIRQRSKTSIFHFYIDNTSSYVNFENVIVPCSNPIESMIAESSKITEREQNACNVNLSYNVPKSGIICKKKS